MLKKFLRHSVLSLGILACFCWSASICPAKDLALASPFADHMVLQRNKPVNVWGHAKARAEVLIEIDNKSAKTTADETGEWHATLAKMSAGGPFTLTATSGDETVAVTDVLVGEVWLASGQSNMQYSVREMDDAEAVVRVTHPQLRLGKVATSGNGSPQNKADIKWSNADAKSAMGFSAVAYTFAHELENDPALANVPVGILEDCLGGTVIESWIPKTSLSSFDPKELQSSMFGIGPSALYNGMISPLGKMSFAGVLWYQGEGNAGEPARYAKLLPLLFQSWRTQFDDASLPFLVIELPDYATDWGGVYWQWIRESESKAVEGTAGTFLCVSINTNDGWNLHPQGKHEIGRRLALLVRQNVYGEKIIGSGPKFKKVEANGKGLLVSFDTLGDGLTSGSASVKGFAVAGEDGVYHNATGIVEHDSVLVTSDEVDAPLTVRYAWAGVPESNLTNRSGLPAAPFRTDTQPVSKGHGELQKLPAGYIYKGPGYQLTLSGEGRVTSFVVHNQQLLSNAPGEWGGGGVGNRSLSHLRVGGVDSVHCSDDQAAFTLDMSDRALVWKVANTGARDAIKFHFALHQNVEVSGDGPEVTLSRKTAQMQVSGFEKVTKFTDIAADDGKVLEVNVPHGETRIITFNIK